MIRKRKPVLFIDDGKESKAAIQLFEKAGIAYITYNIKKFEESCCDDVPTTISPSVFAPEGVYKGLDDIKKYIAFRKKIPNYEDLKSESAYW